MRPSACSGRKQGHEVLTEALCTGGYLLLLLLRLLRQRHVGLVKVVTEVARRVSIHLGALCTRWLHTRGWAGYSRAWL